MSEEWKVVPGYYPGFLEIVGASFKVSIVTTATDLSFEDFCNRTRDAHIMAASKDMLLALQNLENDAGQIPDHAWLICQSAILKATGAQK